ncbi:hypothetical protein [Lichenicola sp.]|uniref:hypothetical protein n=1 Tax=Lichenicola sp. TaxID=2804529 RepID=UPI003B009615
MKRALLLVAALAVPALAQAQTGPSGTGSGTASMTAPRNPDGRSSGTMPRDRGRMDNTVDRIDSKLLNEEKDRPTIPGQTPSPSQTMPGGTAASSPAGAASPH